MNTLKTKKQALNEARSINAFPYCKNYYDYDSFVLYPNVKDYYELGFYIVTNNKCLIALKNYKYIDFEMIGRDVSKTTDGLFTDYGYLFMRTNESLFT